jgi:hypothetical protein
MPSTLTWLLPPPTPVAVVHRPPLASASIIDYGMDFSTYPDLDWNVPISGQEAVVQAAMRSLEDAQLGIDIQNWLNQSFTSADVYALQQAISSSIESDERVQSVAVSVEQPAGQDALTITLVITLADGSVPFTRVLAVTALGVEVLKS